MVTKHAVNFDCVDQFEIGKADYLLNDPQNSFKVSESNNLDYKRLSTMTFSVH